MNLHRVPESPLVNMRLNCIPVGRQLNRTPPNKNPNSQSTNPAEEPAVKHEEDSPKGPQGDPSTGQDNATSALVKEERTSSHNSSHLTALGKMGNTDPDVFIQGMQGYQWTDADLEFVYQTMQQKEVQQLQQELSEVEKTLQAETVDLELAIASRDQLRSELSKSVSCDLLLQLCKSVLERSQTPAQLDGLGDKALLSLLNLQDIQQAVHEEEAQVRPLEEEAQELREKEEAVNKEMDTWRQKISTLQTSVDVLKTEHAELKTRLLKKKTSAASQMPENGGKASRRNKVSTKTLKEKVLKETSKMKKASTEKAASDSTEEGKTAPTVKAPKKMTLRKTIIKDTSPEKMGATEMLSQVKDQERIPTKVKSSNVAEVLQKGRKRVAKNSTAKEKFIRIQKTTALKELEENEIHPLVTSDKRIDLVPDKTAQKKLEELPTMGKVPQVLEKDRTGSGTAKPLTRATRQRTNPRKTSGIEMAEIDTDKKVKNSTKEKALKKVTSKNSAGKVMLPDVSASEVKNQVVPKEMIPKVQIQEMMTFKKSDDTEMTPEEVRPEAIAPKDNVKKLKPIMKKVPKKTADMERPTVLTVEETTATKVITPKVRAQRKTTLKQKDVKQTSWQETAEDDHALNETDKASKKKTMAKKKVKEKTDPEETASENMAKRNEETASTKMAQKKKKETSEKETALQEPRKRTVKVKDTKQKTGKKPSEDEATASAAQVGAQQAVKPPKFLEESIPVPVRRSKRNTVKSQGLSNAIPEKTTRSR